MKPTHWIPVLFVVLFGLLGSVYQVREGHTAIVLNLGKVALDGPLAKDKSFKQITQTFRADLHVTLLRNRAQSTQM